MSKRADVERGFSVNSEVLVENMKKISLVSQRIVYVHCSAIKTDLSSFKVTRELLTSCRGAYTKCKIDLEEKREEVVITDKSKKRKVIQEEIQEIKKRKEDAERCISPLDNVIAKYSLEAEKTKIGHY